MQIKAGETEVDEGLLPPLDRIGMSLELFDCGPDEDKVRTQRSGAIDDHTR